MEVSRQYSVTDIQNMSMKEYSKFRDDMVAGHAKLQQTNLILKRWEEAKAIPRFYVEPTAYEKYRQMFIYSGDYAALALMVEEVSV